MTADAGAALSLPLAPPLAPMLAKPVKAVPVGDYLYEPKWDGFRCVVFRDGGTVELGSRNEKPLTRYFPEIVDAVLASFPPRCVIDCEVVVPNGDRLDFEQLLLRIHPAASRVRLLAEQTPAALVAFDVLALGDDVLYGTPFAQRRALLEELLGSAPPPVHVTPITADAATARAWFEQFEGAGLDGVIAKARDLPYAPDQRLMLKVKHERTADCVVAGFRWHKSGPVIGSLMLGLWHEGRLRHVGVAASFTKARRAELIEELAPLRENALDGHPWADWAAHQAQHGGMTSRWNPGHSLEWQPLRPERVVEVRYGGMEGDRFRHTAHVVRWRDDRTPESCDYSQLDEPVRYDLAEVLGTRG